MQRYVEQLIEDLEAAKVNIPEGPDYEPTCKVLKQIMGHGNAERSIEEWTGIDPIVFPPKQRLNTFQLHIIVDAIVDLWDAFNFIADFPAGMPIDIKYQLLVRHWTEDVVYFKDDIEIIDFCNCHPQSCPRGEFCECKGIWDTPENLRPFPRFRKTGQAHSL